MTRPVDIGELFNSELDAANAFFDRRDRVWRSRPRSLPPIERYLRATVVIPGGSIEAGMQRSRGEPLRLLRSELARVIADEALVLNGEDIDDDNAGPLIDRIEERISAIWPARAWFIEIWQADEAVCQVYAPYGTPRVR